MMDDKKKTILTVKNLHKAFYTPKRTEIIKGINLEIAAGETIAIMGRSGEGKSTLLHLLGTLEKPCKGHIFFKDDKVTFFNKSRLRNRNIGFVFQSFHLLDDYTVLENVLMPARIAREDVSRGSKHYNRAINWLRLVQIDHRTDYKAKLLSGGEKQRVGIVRAFCNEPDLILADEPSGNLDSQTAKEIHSLLLGFVRNLGKAMVVVTHNPDLASLCDRRYFLTNGILNPV